MKQPWFGYDATLAAQGGYLVAPATINDTSADAKPIGTGPFTFKSWSKGNSFEVVKNDSYWQADKPYLDGIDVHDRPRPDGADGGHPGRRRRHGHDRRRHLDQDAALVERPALDRGRQRRDGLRADERGGRRRSTTSTPAGRWPTPPTSRR